MSLDGHVSDKTGGLDFFVKHVRGSYTTRERIAFLESADTIFLGRKTYDQFSQLWPRRPVENDLLAEKMNGLDKVVFSASLQQAPWGEWQQATLETKDPVAKLKVIKTLTGKNIILWGSITLAQTFMKEGLVDEYHLHICPVITGGGRKLFTDDMNLSPLSLLNTVVNFDGVVFLKYGASV